MRFTLITGVVIGLSLVSCSDPQENYFEIAPAPDSICEGCDHADLSIPVLRDLGGQGAVTTYGSVTNPEPSSGGACNYGPTQIMNFAAAHVHLEPGDKKGLWQGGRICGQCVRVRVGSPQGWRSVVVRIVDKCPDGYCGIDLGGAPAATLMGSQPGRYAGDWTWVSCDGQNGVSDGPPAIYVKDGTNAWWSLIQVRNPPEQVQSIHWKCGTQSGVMDWATEAENFFKVPSQILQDPTLCLLSIIYPNHSTDTLTLSGQDLSHAEALYPILRPNP